MKLFLFPTLLLSAAVSFSSAGRAAKADVVITGSRRTTGAKSASSSCHKKGSDCSDDYDCCSDYCNDYHTCDDPVEEPSPSMPAECPQEGHDCDPYHPICCPGLVCDRVSHECEEMSPAPVCYENDNDCSDDYDCCSKYCNKYHTCEDPVDELYPSKPAHDAYPSYDPVPASAPYGKGKGKGKGKGGSKYSKSASSNGSKGSKACKGGKSSGKGGKGGKSSKSNDPDSADDCNGGMSYHQSVHVDGASAQISANAMRSSSPSSAQTSTIVKVATSLFAVAMMALSAQ